jgi:hypothetical protein
VTTCAPGLALGLVVEVLAIGLALDVAEVVVTFMVAELGLGLGFEVDVHPATRAVQPQARPSLEASIFSRLIASYTLCKPRS